MGMPPALKTRSLFSGSFTDKPYTNNPKLCGYNDNFILDHSTEKLKLRHGSAYTYVAHTQPPTSSTRTARLMKFMDESTLLGVAGTGLWYTTLAGTNFTSLNTTALPSADSSVKVSYAEWKNHLFITDNKGSPVAKVYNDGSWRIRTAGLPKPTPTYSIASATEITSAITLVNAIRTAMLAHFADTTMHVTADITSGTGIGSAATNESTLYSLTGQLLTAYQKHFNDARTAATYHYRDIADTEWLTGGSIGGVSALEFVPPTATTAQSTLTNTDTPTNIQDAVVRLNDLKLKYNVHDGVVDIHNYPGSIHTVSSSFLYGFSYGPLIELDYSKMYALANGLKTKINAHMAAGASGVYAHTNADGTNTITSANATTPETLEALLFEMKYRYTAHDDDASLPAAWAWHRADEGAGYNLTRRVQPAYTAPPYPDFYGGVRAGDWDAALDSIIDIKDAYNDHAGHVVAHWSGLATYNPYLILWANFSLANYIYAFVYSYTYTIGGDTFTDLSSPLLVEANSVIPTTVQGLAISNIPSLSNTASTKYDTTNITVKIYRTVTDGTTLYYVGEIANGTTTYTDIVTDTELLNRETIYTTGGVVDNDAPPLARAIHIVNNKAYYGYITDLSGNVIKNRVQESIANDPDSCPADFFDDMEDEVIGISSVKSIPIVFGKRSFYRLEGGFDELGRGALTHTTISDTVGCVSENSIVRTDQGVFFAGTDGFYFTDGYQYTKLSVDWDDLYQDFISSSTKAERITGALDVLNRRIWWGVQRSTSATDNDCALILDLNFPFSPTPTWTSASNDGHFNPTALLFFNGSLYRGDKSGYMFTHSDSLKTDPYIGATASSTTNTKTIIYDFQSTFEDFGEPDFRKWCTWLTFDLKRTGDLNIQPQSRNNEYDAWQDLGLLSYLSTWIWGAITPIWGTGNYYWNSDRGIPSQKRRFPANQVRCTYKQIRITNDYVLIKDSTDTGVANTNGTTKAVTLPANSWIDDVTGYFISFDTDSYATEYEIVNRVSDSQITVSDPTSALTTVTGAAWKIYGYPRNQGMELLEYSILGFNKSKSQQASRVDV